jgi:hypothetical protein
VNPNDEDLDALLRQAFDGPMPDAGFSDRLMQRLPSRRRTSVWPLVAGILAGAGACWLSLGETPLWRSVWRDWHIGQCSSSSVIVMGAMLGMALLALAWTLVEADDR